LKNNIIKINYFSGGNTQSGTRRTAYDSDREIEGSAVGPERWISFIGDKNNRFPTGTTSWEDARAQGWSPVAGTHNWTKINPEYAALPAEEKSRLEEARWQQNMDRKIAAQAGGTGMLAQAGLTLAGGVPGMIAGGVARLGGDTLAEHHESRADIRGEPTPPQAEPLSEPYTAERPQIGDSMSDLTPATVGRTNIGRTQLGETTNVDLSKANERLEGMTTQFDRESADRGYNWRSARQIEPRYKDQVEDAFSRRDARNMYGGRLGTALFDLGAGFKNYGAGIMGQQGNAQGADITGIVRASEEKRKDALNQAGMKTEDALLQQNEQALQTGVDTERSEAERTNLKATTGAGFEATKATADAGAANQRMMTQGQMDQSRNNAQAQIDAAREQFNANASNSMKQLQFNAELTLTSQRYAADLQKELAEFGIDLQPREIQVITNKLRTMSQDDIDNLLRYKAGGMTAREQMEFQRNTGITQAVIGAASTAAMIMLKNGGKGSDAGVKVPAKKNCGGKIKKAKGGEIDFGDDDMDLEPDYEYVREIWTKKDPKKESFFDSTVPTKKKVLLQKKPTAKSEINKQLYEMMDSLFAEDAQPQKAKGGSIWPEDDERRDTVPIWASEGEVVIPRSLVRETKEGHPEKAVKMIETGESL
jgi:hypothetical protein